MRCSYTLYGDQLHVILSSIDSEVQAYVQLRVWVTSNIWYMNMVVRNRRSQTSTSSTCSLQENTFYEWVRSASETVVCSSTTAANRGMLAWRGC